MPGGTHHEPLNTFFILVVIGGGRTTSRGTIAHDNGAGQEGISRQSPVQHHSEFDEDTFAGALLNRLDNAPSLASGTDAMVSNSTVPETINLARHRDHLQESKPVQLSLPGPDGQHVRYELNTYPRLALLSP